MCGSTKERPTSAPRPPAPPRGRRARRRSVAATIDRSTRTSPPTSAMPPPIGAVVTGWSSAWPTPSRRSTGTDSTRRGASRPAWCGSFRASPRCTSSPDSSPIGSAAGATPFASSRRRSCCIPASTCCRCLPTATGRSSAGRTSIGSGPRSASCRRSHDIMAEARIVAAGAQADRGDLTGALATMASVTARPEAGARAPSAPVVRARRPARPGGKPDRGDPLVRARGPRGPGLRRRDDAAPVARTLTTVADRVTPPCAVRPCGRGCRGSHGARPPTRSERWRLRATRGRCSTSRSTT